MAGILRHSFQYVCLAAFVIASCAVKKDFIGREPDQISFQEEDIRHAIYFAGQTDKIRLNNSELGDALARQLDLSGKKSTLLLLGNNSLKVPSVSDSSRKAKEQRQLLKNRYEYFDQLKGKYYMTLGPHEWLKGGRNGVYAATLLEEYIEDQLDQGNVIRPSGGCPGPEEIEVNEDLIILLIDTQWIFHRWKKSQAQDGCESSSPLDFYIELDDAIQRNSQKQIIVAGYHNLAGNGRRGGYFSIDQHFIPLPILGSVNVLLRTTLGDPADLSSSIYKNFIKSMMEILDKHENIIYLSSHEKTQEYHYKDGVHLMNSGSYSNGYAVGQEKAAFASSDRGFGKLLYLKNGNTVLEYWALKENGVKLIYQKLLYDKFIPKKLEEFNVPDGISYKDSVRTQYASDLYTKKSKRPGMLGQNYRKEWITPVSNVPYFDIDKEMGGFKILKRGGGQQTKSLRLERFDEKQYVLRSVEKYPENAVPAYLRNTVAVDIVVDQISASHPYGAYAVPILAEAAGIYHTNPKLFYLPNDPRLGIYAEAFGGGYFLFEERPAKDRSDIDSFGNSDDIVSTFDVLKETRKDSDHYVDQEFTLRSRLFDILIGDWDRHDDQWRWASFKDESDFTFYRPIPRDRDQVFFWSDGWLLNIASRSWGIAKFQGFHDEIRDVDGLSFNARHFDRSFLTEPSRQIWINTARELQVLITDEEIEKAIKNLPEEVYGIHGEDIIRKLKIRRQDLVKYAEEYYEFLAKRVDVLGSDKNERFIVKRLNDEETKVTVLRMRKDNSVKRTVYERVFFNSETEEIRLFGFKGEDHFEIEGDVRKKLKVRIIGGGGNDTIQQKSTLHSFRKNTFVYDTKSGTTIYGGSRVIDRTTDNKPLINRYNRKEFNYDRVMPLIYPQYNPDDGIFIGAGVLIQNNGFRKDPFKSQHVITADIAPRSKSYGLAYSGTFTKLFGEWDFVLNAEISAPSYTDYFYGFGNETRIDEEKFNNDIRYYNARYVQYIFYPEITRRSRSGGHEYTIGGGYQSVNVRSDLNDINEEQDRFIIEYANSLDYDLLDEQRHYIALYGSYTFDMTDSKFMPSVGWKWNVSYLTLNDIDGKKLDVDFQRVFSDVSYFYSFGLSNNVTLALRVGGVVTNGSYEFYHSAKSGGTTTFRGSRKFRFQGDHTFYQNSELRIRLFNIKNPLIPLTVGLTAFHDFGRVWKRDDPSTESGSSDKMLRAYGAGIWLAPLNKIAFGVDYSVSTIDENAFFARFGFFF